VICSGVEASAEPRACAVSTSTELSKAKLHSPGSTHSTVQTSSTIWSTLVCNPLTLVDKVLGVMVQSPETTWPLGEMAISTGP